MGYNFNINRLIGVAIREVISKMRYRGKLYGPEDHQKTGRKQSVSATER